MRLLAPLLLLLAGCAQPARGGGGGIVSTNPCADAILVKLVAPARIAAISHYSRDPGATSLPLAEARRFPVTGGTAEEVIALRPALVLTSSFTPAATRDAYARAGLKTLVLDSPTTVAASIAQVRSIAAGVGEWARGEAMVKNIERSLSARHPGLEPGSRLYTSDRGSGTPAQGRGDEKRMPAAILYIAGDLANGSGTLLDALMTRAGFRNAAADYGLAFTGTLPIETLAAHPPDVVIAGNDGRTAALRRRVLRGVPEARFDRSLVNCGGPTIPAALARLRAIRASL